MPFRHRRLFPGPVHPIFRRRHPKICDRGAVIQILDLRVCAQIPDQDDFVYSRHRSLLTASNRMGFVHMPTATQAQTEKKAFYVTLSFLRSLYKKILTQY
jgi:hypothetical protein